MTSKITIGIAGLALVLAVLAFYHTPQATTSFGGTSNYQTLSATGLQIGTGCDLSSAVCNGTAISAITAGSCTIWANATTITASSTAQVVCQSATNGSIGAITGLTANSICSLNHASSTNTVGQGLGVFGVSASSTAGTIVAQVSNLTGGTFTWTANASSSPQWNFSCLN